MLDDNEIIELFQQGEVQVFEVIVQRYSEQIINFLYRFCWQKELAEDLAQEAFIKVYSSLNTYRISGSFKAYIYKISKNIWIDFLRSKKMKLAKKEATENYEIVLENLKSKEPSAEEVVYYKEKLQILQLAISQLSEDQQMVFTLYQNDMKYSEIAEVLSIPEGTVKSRLHHIFQKLKNVLFDE